MIKDKVVDILAGLDVLKNFTAAQINDHFFKKGYARIVEYQAGERILMEGQYDNWVYWLIEGKVAVIKGDVMIASFQRTGDMFGEMSILEGNARSANVDALCPTLCFKLDMSVLDHPVLKNRISRETFCNSLAQLARERLAKTTCRLSETEKELLKIKQLLQQKEKELEEAGILITQLTELNATQNLHILELTARLENAEKTRAKKP
ncbi:Cyclic nucleotide-binding domain-containing protein [Desulfobotulus alkaliphilus]|uniref:Cyclic nucleotide-binding domain-containing protein n=1 Tax=Desulfobotulus alkaliphilus TaxID=622671 RepID=A0A562S214_9BACT|nr:cyclic nucleotide-binding domain-containing protein [Desulfobotulus alkaliphilus]TWI75367.1 Cyclic nucleotide-binding domain-containing protein [Desulfobotulus alkaliphilus]